MIDKKPRPHARAYAPTQAKEVSIAPLVIVIDIVMLLPVLSARSYSPTLWAFVRSQVYLPAPNGTFFADRTSTLTTNGDRTDETDETPNRFHFFFPLSQIVELQKRLPRRRQRPICSHLNSSLFQSSRSSTTKWAHSTHVRTCVVDLGVSISVLITIGDVGVSARDFLQVSPLHFGQRPTGFHFAVRVSFG